MTRPRPEGRGGRRKAVYKIINTETGAEIGTVENPNYVARHEEGFFYGVERGEARGIAYKSVPYNLFGTPGIGAEETVVLKEYDGGNDAVETAKNAAGIAEIEDAMCEQDLMSAAIEDALCELDKH